MASYTTSLRLVQPATGEYSGSWGTQVNNGLTALVDTSVAGTASITMTAANYTLSSNNGATDEARAMFLVLGGTPGGSYQVICPAVSKLYFVTNNTGFAQTVKTSGGSGTSVPTGTSMTLKCDGTNVVEALNASTSFTLSGALTVGGTTTLAANPTLSAGTANGVLYLNGSKVATSGTDLVFNATGLGIGTTSPAYKLDVSSTGVSIGGRIQTNQSGAYLSFLDNGGLNGYVRVGAVNNNLVLMSGNNINATLDSSGNLGLGVTPSATGASQRSLEVGLLASIVNDPSSNTSTNLAQNAYYDGTNWKYRNSSVAAARYEMTGANAGSTHAWYVSAGGTAGNAISFTQAMTLDASGNLGVGTSSTSGLRLAVDSGATTIAANFNSTNADGVYIRFQNSGTSIGDIGSGKNAVSGGTAGDFGISSRSGALVLGTSSTERARITSGGYFKASNNGTYAGSTATYHEFSQSADDSCLVLAPTNASFTSSGLFIAASRAANAAYYMIRARANAVDQFYVTGDGVIYAQNTTIQSLSDARLKENVRNAVDGLNVVNALRPVRYDWKPGYGNDRKDQLGFIAQEVEAVFPEAVSEWATQEGEDAYKTVGPGALIPVLVKAIQEQQALIAALTARVQALEAQP